MAITDTQKLDYIWKKIGFGASKTDTNANKKAPNEAIPSPLIIRGDKVWTLSYGVPGTIPSANTPYVAVYNDTLTTTVECTEDTTATPRRTWKTNLTNWIPTEFGSTYQVKVYVDDASQSDSQTGGEQLFATGSGNDDEWYFDYSSGVLNFIGTNLPSGVTSGKSIYISGARYIGDLGLSSPSANVYGNVGSFTELVLTNAIGVQSGGTGLTSLTKNGVMFAANTTAFGFVTGNTGHIMQVAANGTPTFGDLDGGQFI